MITIANVDKLFKFGFYLQLPIVGFSRKMIEISHPQVNKLIWIQ